MTPASPTLPRAAVDDAVRAERRSLADLVADLTTPQWDTPSLCTAWTVRHVVAHLTTTTRTTVPHLVRAALPELRGPDVDLLLVAAGRRAGLDALAGPGVAVVAGRLETDGRVG